MVNKLCNPYISQGYSNEYDIITMMYGTNGDVGGIGTKDSTDVTTTWGAMKYCFDRLLYYFRYGKIGVLLPLRHGIIVLLHADGLQDRVPEEINRRFLIRCIGEALHCPLGRRICSDYPLMLPFDRIAVRLENSGTALHDP